MGGREAGATSDLKMPLENGRTDERVTHPFVGAPIPAPYSPWVSRGQASERAVCVCEAEKGARSPPLPAAVVCPPGGRRCRRLAMTADSCVLWLVGVAEQVFSLPRANVTVIVDEIVANCDVHQQISLLCHTDVADFEIGAAVALTREHPLVSGGETSLVTGKFDPTPARHGRVRRSN